MRPVPGGRLRVLIALCSVLAVGTVVVLAARGAHGAGLLSLAGLAAAIESAGVLGPIAFIALFVLGFFVPGPELLLVALGGALFGRVAGFCYAFLGTLLGTSATFFLVRRTAQRWAQRSLQARFPRLSALEGHLVRHGLLTVLGLRLVLFLAPPLNWALGATRVSARDYVLGTALGTLPGLMIATSLGDALAGAGSLDDLGRPAVLLPAVAVVGFLAVAAFAARRFLVRAPAAAPAREDGRRQPHRPPTRQRAAIEAGERLGRGLGDAQP